MASSLGTDKSSSKSTSTTTKSKPPKLITDFGTYTRSAGGNPVYIANEPADVTASRNAGNKSIYDIVSNIPTQMSVEDLYDNPFYQTTYDLYSQPIRQRQAAEDKELNNRLSAGNQLGSSYDAYSRFLQDQRYDDQFTQADNQSRLASADAYTQSLNNQLNTLSGLGQNYQREMANYYKPLELALGQVSAYAPYINSTTTGSQTNSSTPSFLSQYNQYLQSNAQIVKALAGAA